MSNRNEASSLVALRELRDMERRRIQEEAPAQARAEAERREQAQARARAEAERLAQREAEQQAALTEKAAESLRLRHELDGAHREISQLRIELESAKLAHAQLTVAALPAAPPRPRPVAWLGLTAGASMLVGALALTAATRPREERTVSLELPAKPALSCPAPGVSEPRPLPAPAPPAIQPPSPKPIPRPHPAPTGRPHGNGRPPSTTVCDGTDPLCGLPLDKIDDVGKHRRKGDGPR